MYEVSDPPPTPSSFKLTFNELNGHIRAVLQYYAGVNCNDGQYAPTDTLAKILPKILTKFALINEQGDQNSQCHK